MNSDIINEKENEINEISYNKIKLDLNTFENMVMKKSNDNPDLFILSPNFTNIKNNSIILSQLSIFDIEDRGTIRQDKEIINKILTILKCKGFSGEKFKQLKELNINELEKKSIGSMLGMAIGDAMGSTYEGRVVNYDHFDLFDMERENEGQFNLEPGQWSGGTSMGLCIADSLLINNGSFDPYDLIMRFLAWMLGGYNNTFRFNKKYGLLPRESVGLEENISLALYVYLRRQDAETLVGNKDTSGNGSIIRNAAIPICFHYDIALACEMARKQSLTTYQGLEARECCSLLTFIIVKIFQGENLKEILDNLGLTFKSDLKSVEILAKSYDDWNWKRQDYRYNEERVRKQPENIGSYPMDNMSMSLHIIYHTNSFKEAIIKAVNLRGDAGSVASVVGQIAGAYYPIEDIPYNWIERINGWDNGEISLRGYMLSRIHSRKSIYKA